MAVVINEFEVVAEAPPAPAKEGGEAGEQSKPAAVTPSVIAQLMVVGAIATRPDQTFPSGVTP